MSYAAGPAPAFTYAPPSGDAILHTYFNQGPFPVKPVIWFAQPTYGYEGDIVTVVGLGFSKVKLPSAHLKLWMDTQSDTSRPDIEPTSTTWTEVAAAGGSPAIKPAGGTTIGYDKVTFPVTSAMVFDSPEVNALYLESDYGRSARANYTTYPRYAVPIPTTPPVNTAKSVTRIDVSVPYTQLVNTDYVSFSGLRYVISGPYPERVPKHLINLGTYATLSGDALTSGYDDPVSVPLHFLNRFRPDDTKIESRPDLGTGASAWVPLGAGPQRLMWYVPTSPYIDENVSLNTRTRPVIRPALVFDGVTSYARAVQNLAPDVYTNFSYTMLFAVRLFADPAKPRVTLLCMDAGTQDIGDYLIEIAMVNNSLIQFWVGGKPFNLPLPAGYLGSKALLISVRASAFWIEMTVHSTRPQTVRVVLLGKKAGSAPYRPTSFYIGRNNAAGKMNLGRMELFDFAYHPTLLDQAVVTADINALDSVYGGGA